MPSYAMPARCTVQESASRCHGPLFLTQAIIPLSPTKSPRLISPGCISLNVFVNIRSSFLIRLFHHDTRLLHCSLHKPYRAKNLITDLVMYTTGLEGLKDVLIIVANISPLELGIRGSTNTVARRTVQVMCPLWAALCFK